MKKVKPIARPVVSPEFIQENYDLPKIKQHARIILGTLITEIMLGKIMKPYTLPFLNLAFAQVRFKGSSMSILHYCFVNKISPTDIYEWYKLFYAPNAPYDIDELTN